MTIEAIPPGIVLILGAFLLPVTHGVVRQGLVLGLPLLVLALIWQVPDGAVLTTPFLDYELTILRGEAVGRVFATVFAIMAAVGGLFALRQATVFEVTSAFIYAGSAVGVAMAGDLITVFVFWELMAVGSTLIIWAAGTEAAYKASMRYAAVHLFGGVVLMIGIIAHVFQTGDVAFTHLELDGLATWLILIGFLVNAGAPPFSSWLPDAYPEASPSGMVFMSAFTTKTAVYVLIQTFAGADILIYVGVYMACYGIVYALLENDMRRILAYSIINQVGFMICGIGIGTEMALNGATAHAFTHIIYKALLLMSAGSVLYMTGKRKCTDLGGLFQSMPLTCICGTIGALAISSFPMTSGFISKSMISQSAADEHLVFAWFMLMAASAGVFLHAGIKFPWFVFFQKDSGLRPPDPPSEMRLAMIIFAAFCIGLGVYPDPLYAILPFEVDYVPYTVSHVVTMLQLLLFSGLAFFLLLPMMKRTLTITLDTDWFYRRFGVWAVSIGETIVVAVRSGFLAGAGTIVRSIITFAERIAGPNAILARHRSAGAMTVWAIALLGLYLVFNLL